MKFFVILVTFYFVIQKTASISYTVYDSDPNEVYEFEERQPKFYYPYEYARNLELDAKAQEFAGKIQFKYYKNNVNLLNSNAAVYDRVEEAGCSVHEKFAFILHGWRQDCDNTDWVTQLREKLTTYRGGCIICIDYSPYSSDSYFRLMRNFNPIMTAITDKIKDFAAQGFQPQINGYIFGHSFGGQLASAIGRQFYEAQFKNIDICDMAGPGFDVLGVVDHRNAAQNVQCIHTSYDKGTRLYNCHQNFRMGNCGLSQVAAREPPFGSHGLCTYMYVSAFENNFFAVDKPPKCTSVNPAKNVPKHFRMGYQENRISNITGEFFVPTSKTSPYNVFIDSNFNMTRYLIENDDHRADNAYTLLEARHRLSILSNSLSKVKKFLRQKLRTMVRVQFV